MGEGDTSPDLSVLLCTLHVLAGGTWVGGLDYQGGAVRPGTSGAQQSVPGNLVWQIVTFWQKKSPNTPIEDRVLGCPLTFNVPL